MWKGRRSPADRAQKSQHFARRSHGQAPQCTAFPLPNVTKVTPASDSARTVQLVHVERSRRLSRTRAHALRAQLWQLSHVRASSLRAAQPRGNPVARLDCFATLAMTT